MWEESSRVAVKREPQGNARRPLGAHTFDLYRVDRPRREASTHREALAAESLLKTRLGEASRGYSGSGSHAHDTGSEMPSRVGKKTHGRPRGSMAETLTLGRQVAEARADGTPLAFIVEALYTRQTSELSEPQLRAMRSSEPKKALSYAEKIANAADGLATPHRSTSKAVANAMRRYQARSKDHRERYQHFDASSLARRSAPAEFWQSAAELLSLRVELERAMATASGRTPNTKRLELNAAACRAQAGINGCNRA